MNTEAGNKLIAEFMGYVQSEEHNVHLHSANFGFKGSNGYTKPFINKEQYNLLTGFYLANQQTEIDKFYESTRSQSRLPYIFNGVHLFLTAWNNRSTKLDWMPCKLKYHLDWGKLMPVIVKIKSEELYKSVAGDGMYYVLDLFIDEALNEKCDIEKVWTAVVKFCDWYNSKNKV